MFSVAVFFVIICFAQNTVNGKITTQGGMPLSGSHACGKKLSSDVSGNYILKVAIRKY
jgi:iron complex outermembrane receptor protein